MKDNKLGRLFEGYQTALRTHFELGPQASLQAAHDLGTQAVANGLETLDLARIHDHALATLVLPDCAAITREDMTRRAAKFFTEAITPIEKTHRLALEASADLKRVNATLERRTQDFADSKRDLKEGITRRRAAEKALKTSGEQTLVLLEESRHLQKHLQEMAHRILTAHEDERKRMSLMLQDEIAQTMLGLHVRLLALKKEVSVCNDDFKKEIAITQRLVEKSLKTINHFAREFDIPNES